MLTDTVPGFNCFVRLFGMGSVSADVLGGYQRRQTERYPFKAGQVQCENTYYAAWNYHRLADRRCCMRIDYEIPNQ